ncbi:hypothetical protein AB4144_47400, partial [Rhizobiaceae sp. 2RAB30]
GVERDFHEMASLFREAAATLAPRFSFNKLLGGLPRKHADELDKARIGFAQVTGRQASRWFENHPHSFGFCPSWPGHKVILALERTIPLRAKTGPIVGGLECEIAGISATFSVERRP